MPAKRSKGVTFKLVHQPYDEANTDDAGRTAAVMVDERELRRHLPTGSAAAMRRRRERNDKTTTSDINAWAQEWNTTAATRVAEKEAYMNRRNMLLAQVDDADADNDDNMNKNNGMANANSDVAGSRRKQEETNDGGSETESDDKLFDDQEEVEFTDDFLRELVLGGGDISDGDDGRDDDYGGSNGDADDSNADEGRYVQHDVAGRGAERQFTRMLREFEADARLNDAYTDDPRTHGGAGVSQYLRALEEFVVDRAGLDCATAAPRRHRGLLQQLRTLAQHAGTDMSPSGEVYTTTVMPERQARFVEAFRNETEEIRRAARERVLAYQQEQQQKQQQQEREEGEEKGASAGTTDTTNTTRNAVVVVAGREEEEEEEEEVYIVKELKDKANRMDCETVVSTYSTYFNQPNVIRAAPRGKKRKGCGNTESTLLSSTQQRGRGSAEEEEGEEVPDLYTQMLMLTRDKEETKDEKKLRKQLAKQAQRERRSKKKELKHAYKVLEVDEAKRSKESQTAKKTVHFF
ncbi:hypothetical protein LSM04_001782 [Trypanosoma melophagium]|uniref:uncharacterized protein n=1 Tax=Trypanosoma melophagium TaxID=715481 RepID=UPI00351A2D5A|nr:hypothetical protein LSM04_001782 [Trypanosoma melophagium]